MIYVEEYKTRMLSFALLAAFVSGCTGLKPKVSTVTSSSLTSLEVRVPPAACVIDIQGTAPMGTIQEIEISDDLESWNALGAVFMADQTVFQTLFLLPRTACTDVECLFFRLNKLQGE